MGRVELLAPAGTPDALRAAIAAGADAVYVGLGAFNARAANGGFSLGELADGCALAHSRAARVYVTLNVCLHDRELPVALELAFRAIEAGADALIVADLGLCSLLSAARVYVTLNVCLHDRELPVALELAFRAIEAGADALIVADLGLCSLLKREMPSAELHLSTQAGAQSPSAVRLAARELGASRVTCARELSVAELASLARTGVEIEAFCHGAICICYSGACAYSALMRGRSANRGDCTQEGRPTGAIARSPADSHTSCRTAGAASSPGARGSGAARARVTGCCAPATTWGSAMWASWSAPESRPSRSRGG